MSMEVPEEFTVAVRRDGARAVVEITGELDMHTAKRVDEQLSELIESASTIEIDASAVSFIDSAGLQVLLSAREAAGERGARLSVTAASERVSWVAQVAGVADLVTPQS